MTVKEVQHPTVSDSSPEVSSPCAPHRPTLGPPWGRWGGRLRPWCSRGAGPLTVEAALAWPPGTEATAASLPPHPAVGRQPQAPTCSRTCRQAPLGVSVTLVFRCLKVTQGHLQLFKVGKRAARNSVVLRENRLLEWKLRAQWRRGEDSHGREAFRVSARSPTSGRTANMWVVLAMSTALHVHSQQPRDNPGQEHRSTERLCNLPKVTQLVSGVVLWTISSPQQRCQVGVAIPILQVREDTRPGKIWKSESPSQTVAEADFSSSSIWLWTKQETWHPP